MWKDIQRENGGMRESVSCHEAERERERKTVWKQTEKHAHVIARSNKKMNLMVPDSIRSIVAVAGGSMKCSL